MLREEAKKTTDEGIMIAEMMKEGKIVPGDVTIRLLQKAIFEDARKDAYFLIDGFPREMEQALAFEKAVCECIFALFYECPLDILEQRLLKRGQTSGRADDNLESIRKRFITYQKQSMPVIEYLKKKGKVRHVISDKPVDQVFEETVQHFAAIDSSFAKSIDTPLTAEAVESMLKELAFRYRIQLQENFRDYDPLRAGCVTVDQFKNSLGVIKLPKTKLLDQHYVPLINKYKFVAHDGKTMVNYRTMLNEIGQSMLIVCITRLVFAESQLEKQPAKSLSQFTLTMKRFDASQPDALIQHVKHIVQTNGILLKPWFQDFDQVSMGTFQTRVISKTRFERALSMLNIKLTPAQVAELADKYDYKKDGSVHYVDFIHDVQGNMYKTEPNKSCMFNGVYVILLSVMGEWNQEFQKEY